MHRRWMSSSSRRVLCSFEELRARRGSAIKFPMSQAAQTATTRPSTRTGGRTGFVFYCEATDAPRAFLNSCPHALLELDLDDSDFFCDGFILCKAHGAFFDPETGICLKGPAATRRGRLEKQLGALTELPVELDDNGQVVLLPMGHIKIDNQEQPRPTTEEEWQTYRSAKQQELGTVLAQQNDEIQRIQDELQAKALARMRRYAADQSSTHDKNNSDKPQ